MSSSRDPTLVRMLRLVRLVIIDHLIFGSKFSCMAGRRTDEHARKHRQQIWREGGAALLELRRGGLLENSERLEHEVYCLMHIKRDVQDLPPLAK